MIQGTLVVMRFELGRMALRPRVFYLGLLFAVPVLLIMLLRFAGASFSNPASAGVLLFVLYPQVICLLGVLLLTTTGISSELEGGTWVYLATRPAGRKAVLLGKYLAGATGAAVASVASLLLALILTAPQELFRVAGSVLLPTLLSPFTFGAIFLLFGTLFLKRAMAVAILYVLIVEVVVSFIPAVVNKFTVSYALRSLAAWAYGLSIDETLRVVVGDPEPLRHFLALGLIVAVCLSVACYVLERRQLVSRVEV